MFRIGDKILHPLHGVGVIESIADQEVLGKDHKYYMVNLTMKNMKVMVPVESADEIGVRRIIKSEVIDEVLLDLKSKKTSEMPANWNRRYKHNLEKIKTGNVHEVAEVLRNGSRDKRRLDADKRRRVGCRDDHDRPPHPLGTQVVLDELAHLAATLANQRDDVHVGGRVAGRHAHQRALADAASREDAHALALRAGHQRVYGANAEAERLGQHPSLHG